MSNSTNESGWGEWTFTEITKKNFKNLFENLEKYKKPETDFSKEWSFLTNFTFPSDEKVCKNNSQVDTELSYDIEEKVNLVLEYIENNIFLEESRLNNIPERTLSTIFSKVKERLDDTGFTKLCEILSQWNNPVILDATFHCVIFEKLNEKEEASLNTINAITKLSKTKPEEMGKCIIKLLTSNLSKFSDEELLGNMFIHLPNAQKEAIVKALTSVDDFKENQWSFLQVMSMETTDDSLKDIISFMDSKSKEFARSQVFARLLLHICRNVQSDFCNDILLRIAENNQTLLKRQAVKYLS